MQIFTEREAPSSGNTAAMVGGISAGPARMAILSQW